MNYNKVVCVHIGHGNVLIFLSFLSFLDPRAELTHR